MAYFSLKAYDADVWVQDFKGNNLLLFTSEWCVNWALQKNEGLRLREFNRD